MGHCDHEEVRKTLMESEGSLMLKIKSEILNYYKKMGHVGHGTFSPPCNTTKGWRNFDVPFCNSVLKLIIIKIKI